MNNNILTNIPLICATCACLIAQGLKPIITKIIHKESHLSYLFTTGGMPSSHTATTVALSTSVAMIHGFGSTLFAVSAALTFIVMHDACNIRNAAGKQAKIINQWSEILSKIHQDGGFTPENLKTMLGHTFPQVLVGALLGILIGVCGTYLLQGI